MDDSTSDDEADDNPRWSALRSCEVSHEPQFPKSTVTVSMRSLEHMLNAEGDEAGALPVRSTTRG